MSPFDAILDQSREVALERFARALTITLEKSEEWFAGELAKAGDDAERRKTLDEGRGVLAAHRGDLEGEFLQHCEDEFRKRVSKVRKALHAEEDEGDVELELLADDDLNETLRFKEFATQLRRRCDEELGALDQRVAVLVGDANLQSEDNPVGPQALCDAYKLACRAVHPRVDVRLVLLEAFGDLAYEEVREGYRELNDILVENSILPKIKYEVKKKDSALKPGAPGTAEDGTPQQPSAAAEVAIAMAAGKDVFGILQKVLAAGGALGPVGDGSLAGTQLQDSLTKIQHGDLSAVSGADLAAAAGAATNLLKGLKQSNVGASLGEMDSMTLDIVSMLFDQLFDDARIPAGVKALAGRLQIPILKIALADKSLFSKKDHPARLTLDILGELSARLPADFDSKHALFPALEKILLEVIEGFNDKVDVFVAANEKLRALLTAEDQRADQQAQGEAKKTDYLENLSVGRAAAQEEIRARIRDGKAPRPILEFLVKEWIKVLLVVHARDGRESPAWKEALQTMDDMLWSVEQKATAEERRKIPKMVPSLLKRLTAGLASVGVEDSVRAAFFGELMKWHTFVMGGENKAAAKEAEKEKKAPKPERGTAAAIAAQLEAAAQEKKKEEEEQLDFTPEIAVKNPFGEGQVEVDELDFTPASAAAAALSPVPGDAAAAKGAKPAKPAPAKAPPKEVSLPAKLKEGVWVGIRSQKPEDPRQPAKLLYMSPLKTRFLFCDRRGKTLLECNRAELAKKLRSRDVVILSQSPDSSIFERIIQGVLGKLGNTATA